MPKTSLSLNLDPMVEARLRAEAEASARSEVELVETAIENYLETQSEKRRQLRAAVLEADRGVFVSEEMMNVWLDRWDENLAPPEPDIFPKPSK